MALPTWDPVPSIRQLLTRSRTAAADTQAEAGLRPTLRPSGALELETAAEDLPSRYVTRGAIRNRRGKRCRGHFASNKGRLNAVSQLRCPRKEREEWFSLQENREKAFRIGLYQSRNRRGHPCKQPAGGIDRCRTMRRGIVGQVRAPGSRWWCCWRAHLQPGRRPNQPCPRSAPTRWCSV